MSCYLELSNSHIFSRHLRLINAIEVKITRKTFRSKVWLTTLFACFRSNTVAYHNYRPNNFCDCVRDKCVQVISVCPSEDRQFSVVFFTLQKIIQLALTAAYAWWYNNAVTCCDLRAQAVTVRLTYLRTVITEYIGGKAAQNGDHAHLLKSPWSRAAAAPSSGWHVAHAMHIQIQMESQIKSNQIKFI